MVFDKAKVDYSVYLVTNNELVPEGLTIYDQVEKALQNGTTVVQLREKKLDTGAFITRAERIHELTKKYNVPLIINDRVDVALAIDAEGVHVGQDDMNPVLVRKMIGDDKILGLTTHTKDELLAAINSSASIDYVGMGPAYSTTTKVVKDAPLGPEGIQKMLRIISENKPELKSVIIGGLNKTNIAWTLSECAYEDFNVNGVAVVSCIMGQYNASLQSREVSESVKIGFSKLGKEINDHPVSDINPVVHFITNSVVKNISANVCMAVGGSPIMSEFLCEFKEFAKSPHGSLVLNTGTPTVSSFEVYKEAVKAYNAQMLPIVYDPVACGATNSRRQTMQELMKLGQFTVIKGNLAELASIAGLDGSSMRGVDSIMKLEMTKTISMLRKLAKESRSVIVMTGKIDIIVDGIVPNVLPKVCTIEGGHEFMTKVTGGGCSLGGVIATYVASANYFDTFEATVNAVALYKEAGFNAGQNSRGPGSFMANFLDSLYKLSSAGKPDFVNTVIQYK